MKKNLTKCLGFLASFVFLAGPTGLSAHSDGAISYKDVAGTYSFSGFSNSLDGPGTLSEAQSQATVGQAKLKKDGTGFINFVDFVAVIGDQIVDLHNEDVPFTYVLGPKNGYGTVTVPDFPFPGSNPTFALSFKSYHGKIVGFSQLTISSNLPTARWTLIQGKRFD